MRWIKAVLVSFLVLCSVAKGNAQADKSLLSTWTPQLEGMVRFFQYSLNLLGSDSIPAGDKEIIINESYLRIFRDAEVQIEDDLLENRREITNKNVQAYLRDVDFFFEHVQFKYHIIDIRLEVNEKGAPYFRIETKRTLEGLGLEGETIKNHQTRYFEVSLDQSRRELKIVSVYTRPIGQAEELSQWWASLPMDWKVFISKDISLPNSRALLSDILVADSLAGPGDRYKIGEETVSLEPQWLGPAIQTWLSKDSLDLTGTGLTDLEPLSRMRKLTWLNVAGLPLSDLKGLRNATQLQYLNISGTQVRNLEPLRFCEKLRVLHAAGSQIYNAAQLKHLIGLEEAYLTGSPLDRLDGIQMAGQLTLLDLDSTLITSLAPLAGLPRLQQLSVAHCKISDVSPLASCPQLERVNLENSLLKDLLPLKDLAKLRYVFCDDTPVSSASVAGFQHVRPDVLVMFGTSDIQAWWEGLPPVWKEPIQAKTAQGKYRTKKEYLHALIRIDSLALPNRRIENISPLRFLSKLEYLDLSNNPIADFSPLAGLSKLKVLKVNQTGLEYLGFVQSMSQLREIYFNRNKVKSLSMLTKLPQLNVVQAEENPLDSIGAIAYLADRPEWALCWHSAVLEDYWNSLDSAWQALFLEILPKLPGREELHRLETLKGLDLSKRPIKSLTPLARLPLLESLNISGLGLSDLSALAQVNTLKTLDISDNPISDLSPLRRNGALQRLDAGGTLLENPEQIRYFLKLEHLNLASTPFDDLSGFEVLEALRHLDVSATEVRQLKHVYGLKHLRVLRVFNSRVRAREVEKLREMLPDCEVVHY